MRAFKRAFARIKGEIMIAPRRRAVARTLQAHFGLPAPPDLVLSGSRGHDSIYRVMWQGRAIGMLRLVNPYRRRKPLADGLPFVSVPPETRIAREAQAYRAGCAEGITPAPLWQAADALCCAYLPLQPMHAALLADPRQAWTLVMTASAALRRLHALGITHADASLANALSDPEGGRVVFVDFEYAPAPHVPPRAARLYDYLRLLESTLKFMPPDLKEAPDAWLSFMVEVAASEGFVQEDLMPLLPALPYLSSRQRLFSGLQGALSGAVP